VLGSPVVPITTIGPAPAPVISIRGSSASGKKVQKYEPVVSGNTRGAIPTSDSWATASAFATLGRSAVSAHSIARNASSTSA
jgi:hypothetical protein